MSVVRELLLGPKRFSELQRDVPGIGPTILTRRLHSLLESGVVQRPSPAAESSHGSYELTDWGYELESVNAALAGWGAKSSGLPVEADMSPDTIVLAMRAHARPSPRRAGKEVVLLRIRERSDEPAVRGTYRATMSADATTVVKPTDNDPADHDALVLTSAASLKAVIIAHTPYENFPDFTFSGSAEAVERLLVATRF